MQERISHNAQRVAALQAELAGLSSVSASASALRTRADALAEAVAGQNRELRQRVRMAHARQLSTSEADAKLVRGAILSSLSEEMAGPSVLLADGPASRLERAIARADEQLASDPYACLRSCLTRTYQTWGALCLQSVRLLGLVPAAGQARGQ